MVEYSKVNVKLPDRQLKQLKTAVKESLEMSLGMLDGNDLPQLTLTRRQKQSYEMHLITICQLI